ncbi:MAG: rhamnulokinase [Clostridia bacterium]|nr:rhamnulokinase [Clostridia bacterium]
MGQTCKVLAFDFGASSGRGIVFEYDGQTLKETEIHRFSNDPVMVNGHLYWDILRLFHEIKQGILKCVSGGHHDIEAIGIDTWGVDFALFDEHGTMMENPFHYRDTRTQGMMELADQRFGNSYLFEKTGIQFNFFNTLYQLMALTEQNPEALQRAKRLLFIPDIFNYFLTGEMKNEYTIASTSQLLDAHSRRWCTELLDKANIPTHLFETPVLPGTVIGNLRSDICEELGCPAVPVVAVGSHDTASAVASVPAEEGENYVYISTGTWALLGAELDSPLINQTAFAHNFTNEGGVAEKIRFLKNIMGLWIIQESRRQWQREGKDYSFADLEQKARASRPLASFIDPDHDSFATPGNMPEKIRRFCRETNQPIPETEGEVIRTAAESLALKCAHAVFGLEEVFGKSIDVIHMVGGGIKDTMVCQFIANASGKRVVAGPVEATGTGNAIVQMMALGKIPNLSSARKVVQNATPTKEYLPQDASLWQEAYQRFTSYLD